MEKEIIAIVFGKSRYSSLNYFSEELAYEFQTRGYEIVYVDTNNVDSFRNSLLYMYGKKIKGIFGFNGVCIDLESKDGYRLSELLDTTYYGLYVDHPLYHAGRHHLIRHRNVAFFVDKRHVEYAKKIYSAYDNIQFLPLGGTPHCNVSKISERRKSVAIFGSYSNPDMLHQKIETEENETNKTIIYTVINTMINDGVDINVALDLLLKNINVNVNNEDYENITNLLAKADGYVRNYNRYKVLKSLLDSGIDVDIYGAGWEQFACSDESRKHLHIYETVDYFKSLELMEEYKIVINIMPCFMDGSHDRVFNSLLAGTVCVTDKSKYLLDEFDENENIVFYDINDTAKLPKIINELLANEELMQKIADNGKRFCENNHLWKNRVDSILEVMSEM